MNETTKTDAAAIAGSSMCAPCMSSSAPAESY
jgi:hypothetical protein